MGLGPGRVWAGVGGGGLLGCSLLPTQGAWSEDTLWSSGEADLPLSAPGTLDKAPVCVCPAGPAVLVGGSAWQGPFLALVTAHRPAAGGLSTLNVSPSPGPLQGRADEGEGPPVPLGPALGRLGWAMGGTPALGRVGGFRACSC